jgi:hypothetical protein
MMLLPALLLVVPACVSNEELGTACVLVRRDPAGGAPVAVTEGELPLAQADYLSFGAAPCTEVCVRGANAVRTGDNSAPAGGHCSRACSGEGSGDCPTGFSCRAMLLDVPTMQALCSTEPAKCRQFGADPWPLYCVKD